MISSGRFNRLDTVQVPLTDLLGIMTTMTFYTVDPIFIVSVVLYVKIDTTPRRINNTSKRNIRLQFNNQPGRLYHGSASNTQTK